jgi:hypothetical protein
MSLGSFDENLLQYEIKDFSKGLINSLTDINIPAGGGDIVKNARLDDVGGIKVRDNRAQYNVASLGSNPVMYVKRIYIGTNRYFLSVYDTKLKVGSDSAGSFSDLDTVTSGRRYRGVTYKNFHYLFNGIDANMKTAGTSATSDVMGCKAMAAAPTGAKNATGVLTVGTYKYYFTWEYDSYQQSSRGGYLAVAVDASDSIDLYDFETTPVNATHMRIYRTLVDGSTYYYHSRHTKAQVEAYLTGAKYNDNTADADLDTTTQAPTDNGVPPICKYAALHKDRIFLTGYSGNKSRVYYSHIASGTSYPDIFPALNYIDIAQDDGDENTGLAHDPTGALCVLKNNTIRKIYTDGDPVNWSVSEPFSYNGCIAPYTISESPYGVIFVSRLGELGKQLMLFNGQLAQNISDKVSIEINKILSNRITECEGIYHEGKYSLTFTDKNLEHGYNDTQLIYDFQRQAFVTDGKDINCFCSWYGSEDRGELYTGDSQIGVCYREDSGEGTYDVVHKLQSELSAGVETQVEYTLGTETNPILTLDESELDDDVGNLIVSTLDTSSEEVQDYAAEDETVSPSGMLISDYIEINASALSRLMWNESLGTNGDVQFWIRTGVSTGAVGAASWEGPYTDPNGSDISAITAAKYIQYKVRLYTNDTDVVATPKLFLNNGYVIKIFAGCGTPTETAIYFNFQMGQLDLGSPRQIKRFRGIRVEYESESSGNLYVYYSLDRGTESSTFIKDGVAQTYINLATYTSKYTANFPYDSFGELIKLRFYKSDSTQLTIKRLVLLFTVKPPRF